MEAAPFQIMVKPVGPRCDLACRYCYYLPQRARSPGGAPVRMSPELRERYIEAHLAAAPAQAAFAWHGGEPTLYGLDGFGAIVAAQKRRARPGQRIVNNLQTNGLALDEEWARFLAEERFSVGLSLDGPRAAHDAHRVSAGGRPSHAGAVAALRLLARHGVHTDVLCVVHDKNVGDPRALYDYFRGLGVRSLQLLPLVEREGDGVSARTAPAAAYGELLCAIFDEWARADVGRVVVQIFDEAFRPLCGVEHALCVFRPTCGEVLVVEHDGAVYSCDHFVDDAHRLGSVVDAPLEALVRGPAQARFGAAKRDTLPALCRRCDVLAACNGGCPKDRFLTTPDGEPGLSYLCAGLSRFFRHSRPWLTRLAGRFRAGEPLASAAAALRAEDARRAPAGGRNDPCPCGSGKKWKRCCGR